MTKKPNIIVMMSDQHSGPILGVAGDSIADTPNLDQLAQNGVLFQNTYCPSPLCVPSRMAFMTSQYPSDISIHTNRDYLASDIPTFAHALSANGYRTCLVGRMHFIGPDQMHGFDERRVNEISVNWPGSPLIDFGDLNKARGSKGPTIAHSGFGETATHRYDHDVTQAACNFLEEAKENPQPFCLVVGWYGPHPPFIAPKDDYEHMRGKVPPPRLPQPKNEHSFLSRWRDKSEFDHVPHDAVERARTAYYGMVHMIDRMAGQIIDKVTDLGLKGDSLMVYTSDHGEQLGERGFWHKSTFYDQSAKVPLIMSWPENIPKNKTRDQAVNLIDLAATIVAAGKAAPLPNARGTDLLPMIKTNKENKYPTYSEFYGGLVSIQSTSIVNRMIRQGPWKLNYYHGYPAQLFHMINDPDEMNDLADIPIHQEIFQKLMADITKGWTPESIMSQMAAKADNIYLLKRWTKNTTAKETHRWIDQHSENNWYRTD